MVGNANKRLLARGFEAFYEYTKEVFTLPGFPEVTRLLQFLEHVQNLVESIIRIKVD